MEQVVGGERLDDQDWFLVLPDHEFARSLVDTLPSATRRLSHPSGRPWVVGRWDPADLRVGDCPDVRLAVLGHTTVESEELTDLAHRVRDHTDLPRLISHLAGSSHVLASIRGTAFAQGTLSGLRRIFHTRVGELSVAADRADPLARLIGAAPDERALALRLVVLAEELPVRQDRPMWRGVTAVPEDSYLSLDEHGRVHTRRRWSPPAPVLSVEDGASGLRTALIEAVRVRVDSGRALSADLSGGLDSTTLCFLAARGDRPLTTFTTSSGDAGDDDLMWADRAAAALPGTVDRVLATADELPLHYADLTEPGPALDEPFPGVADRPEYREIAHLLRARGARLHLTGDGGDEVLQDSNDYLAELLRTDPLLGLRRLWIHRTVNRWPWWAVFQHTRLPRDHRSRLLTLSRTVGTELPHGDVSRVTLGLPPWATTAAVELVRDVLRDAAAACPPVGVRGHAQEQLVSGIVYSGHVTRLTNQFSAAVGLPASAPFLDDAVLNACLAVRVSERTTPWEYKPLLTRAMFGIVPAASLERRTKAEGSSSGYAALRRNRAHLLALCENSRLAELGLLDPDRLREECSTSMWHSDFMPVAFSNTFSAERWLRDLELSCPLSTLADHR